MDNNLSPLERIYSNFKTEHEPVHENNNVTEQDADVKQILASFKKIENKLKKQAIYHNNDLYQMLSLAILNGAVEAKPSCTMIQISETTTSAAENSSWGGNNIIKSGLQISSNMGINENGVRSKEIVFSTKKNLSLAPIEIKSAAMSGSGTTVVLNIKITASETSSTNIKNIVLNVVNKNPDRSSAVFQALASKIQSIEIYSEKDNSKKYSLDPSSVSLYGYDSENNIFIDKSNEPDRDLLISYFIFPDRLKSITIDLGKAKKLFASGRLGNDIVLRLNLDNKDRAVDNTNVTSIRVNCVPSTNVFKNDSTNAVVDGLHSSVLLESKNDLPIKGVHSVVGVDKQGNKRTYSNLNDMAIFGASKNLCYSPRISQDYNESRATIELSWGKNFFPIVDEIISAKLYCSNGRDVKGFSGDLDNILFEDGDKQNIAARNVTSLTSYVAGMPAASKIQALLEYKNISQFTLKTKEQLIKYLTHIQSLCVNNENKSRITKTINSIKSIEISSENVLLKGKIIHGQNININIDYLSFNGTAEIFLFGCVLDYLYASYCPFNNFTQLTIINDNGESIVKFKRRVGDNSIGS